MEAKSINTAALLLKTLLLAGFIIFTVKSGMAQTTRYWIGGGTTNNYDDGDNWSENSGGAKIGATINWDLYDIMIFDVNSSNTGIAINVIGFPSELLIGGVEISGNKTVNFSSATNPCTIILIDIMPINIESGSNFVINSAGMTVDISPLEVGISEGSIDGVFSTGLGLTNTALIINTGATINASGPIYGFSNLYGIGTFILYGSFITNSYVNCVVLDIKSSGIFKTSYIGDKGWWYSNIAPNVVSLSGTVEFSGTSDQIIPSSLAYLNIAISGSGKKIVTASQNVNCSNLTINDGILEISSTSYLKVTSTLTNNVGAQGLVLKSDATGTASLIHSTPGIQATVERYISNNFKWHFLSSPVSNQAIWPQFAPEPSGNPLTYGIGPNYNWDFYYYNPNALIASQLYWVNLRKDASGAYNNQDDMANGSIAGFGTATLQTPPKFVTGRGYLSAYNTGWNSVTESPETHIFTGALNTGSISCPVVNSANAYNLVGNPYPSTINWSALTGWLRSSLVGSSTLGYDYWIYNDTYGNYGVYNSKTTIGTNGVTRYIAPGQAFFVKALSNGNLVMSNSVRVTNAQPWLKNTDTANNFILLKITSSANTYRDEMIVEFDDNLTGGGTEKFWSFYTEAPELYSVKDGNNYSIDRYNALADDMKINIAAKTGVAATYTITASNIADFTLRDKVYLLDMKTGIKTNLKQTPSYSFAGTPDDDRNRFQLIFGTSIGVDEETSVDDITIYASDNTIYVRNDKASQPYTVVVSNMLGQVITRTKFAGNTLNQVNMNHTPGVYVVTVYSDGSLFSKKVVVK